MIIHLHPRNPIHVKRKVTFGTINMLSTTERELNVWKKWFLKVARPPSSTGMRRPQERREMNTATGNDTSLRMDVTPAIGTSLLVAYLMSDVLPCIDGTPSSIKADIECKQSRTSP